MVSSFRWSLAFLALALLTNSTLAQGPAVPGFTRFYSDGKDAAGGHLLINELHCARCHAAAPSPLSPLPQGEGVKVKSAPILDAVGARVKPAYLKHFLADPQKTKPGTKMPNVLAGLPDADRQATAEALAHFLASTGALPQARPDKKSIAAGRDLYHKVGCVACHGSRDTKGEEAKRFATSVPLGDLKTKYVLASLQKFLENPHQTRPNGRMPGLLNAKEAGEVANYLMQGAGPVGIAENMTYSYYELGDVQNLPDFSKLKPKATGAVADFDLGIARRISNVAVKFEGNLKIDKNGNYTFHVHSDDGSRLWIGDKLVVDNDGVHPPQAKSGKVKLTKGMHKLVIAVFNAGGGFELQAEIEGAGNGRQPLGPWVHLTEKGDAKPGPIAKGPEAFVIQPELVAKGKQHFAALGCANCHQLKDATKTVPAPALAALKGEGGCLDAMPKKGTAWYDLSAAQRSAIQAALRSPAPAAADAKKQIAFTMTAMNCYACHERDKKGGVEEATNPFFQATFKEWGDEARLPPILTGVGAKLNPAYLKKVIEQGAHDRNYMHTRMPKFGSQATHLVSLLETVDVPLNGPTIAFTEQPTKIKSIGRQMVGKNAFGCINCHNFGGVKTEGVQGIDMALMTERLRKDWFHNYMLNPSKYRPGTRMPTSFPDGTTPFTKLLDGKADRQIEAIWVYLADGKAATVPIGMTKSSIPLVPTTEAIIYRNFIQGAGPRAIGVGYPEKANLAFDANDIRLAMIWQGAFIDARRHWSGRGEGYEPPLGDNILHLPKGVTFAPLSQPDEPWPTANAKDQGYRFLGYRLSDDQRPTFLYAYKEVRIEDFPNALETKTGHAIRRVFTLTADNAPEKLYLRAAVAAKITAEKNGWYRINDWRMRIESDATPQIRRVGKQMELVVPVQFKGKTAKIVQEYAW